MKNSKVRDTTAQNPEFCLQELKKSGYDCQFQITPKGLFSGKSMRTFNSDELKIVHHLCFDNEADPNNNSIVYALETCDEERGTLVIWCGIFSHAQLGAFMQKVQRNINN